MAPLGFPEKHKVLSINQDQGSLSSLKRVGRITSGAAGEADDAEVLWLWRLLKEHHIRNTLLRQSKKI